MSSRANIVWRIYSGQQADDLCTAEAQRTQSDNKICFFLCGLCVSAVKYALLSAYSRHG